MGSDALARAEKLQVVSLEEQVLKALRGSILRGETPPGSRLSTRELAAAYGVSAMPVRVAVKQLEAEGLVRISPQRYVSVIGLTTEDLMEVNRIRSVLEGLAVRLSTQRAQAGDPHERDRWLTDVRNTLQQLELADREGDIAAFVDNHNTFHLLLDAHNNNGRLLGEITKLYDYIAFFREVIFNMPGKREASMAEHRSIFAAVEADDADLAEHRTRLHIQTLEDHLDELRKATGSNGQTTRSAPLTPSRGD